jgi:hypothetical protein
MMRRLGLEGFYRKLNDQTRAITPEKSAGTKAIKISLY